MALRGRGMRGFRRAVYPLGTIDEIVAERLARDGGQRHRLVLRLSGDPEPVPLTLYHSAGAVPGRVADIAQNWLERYRADTARA